MCGARPTRLLPVPSPLPAADRGRPPPEHRLMRLTVSVLIGMLVTGTPGSAARPH